MVFYPLKYYNRFIDIEKEKPYILIGGDILVEIIKPEIRDIVSYPVQRSQYGTTVQVARVIDWVDEETLRVLAIPELEIRKIKSSLVLKIISQDDIKKAISSVQNKK